MFIKQAALSTALALTLSSLCCDQLHAAGDQETSGIAFGATTLLPALQTELRYDDNIFESNDNERDALIAVLAPSLSTLLERGDSRYELGYSAESARYFDSEDDDYVDHQFQALANMQFSLRNNITVSAGFAADHEDRGTGLTEGFDPTFPGDLDEPDEYDQTDAGARYTYGARNATGRLAFEVSYRDIEYQNHRLRTAVRDREDISASATFRYRVRSNTSLLLQAQKTTINYAQDRPLLATLDSDYFRYLIGAEWDNSEQLAGAIKLGYQQKKFESDDRSDFSAPSWEIDLTWSPLSYSRISFKTERGTQETNGGGDFIDVQRFSTEWTHDWNDRLQTSVALSHEDEEFENFERDEQVNQFYGRIDYQMRRWFALQLGFKSRDRSSNLQVLDFSRNILSIGLDITI